MTKPECGKCRFFKPLWEEGSDPEDEDRVGECHRYAPRPNVGTMNGAQSDTLWPVNYVDDWCGEFKPATEPKKTAADESRWPDFIAQCTKRIHHCLATAGIESFADLDSKQAWEIMNIPNLGGTSWNLLRHARKNFPGYPKHWKQ